MSILKTANSARSWDWCLFIRNCTRNHAITYTRSKDTSIQQIHFLSQAYVSLKLSLCYEMRRQLILLLFENKCSQKCDVNFTRFYSFSTLKLIDKFNKYIQGVFYLVFFSRNLRYLFVSSDRIDVCIVFFVRELPALG